MENTYQDLPADYENRLKEKSLNGSSGTRKQSNIIRIKKDKFKRAVAIYTLAIALATGTIIGGGSKVVHNIQDGLVVSEMVFDFQRDCINHETHRTLDNEHYYYDYNDIIRYIEENEEDFDVGVYLFYRNTSEYQTERLMQSSTYHSMDQYLQEHHYESFSDWAEATRKKAVLMHEVDEREQELQDMAQEHGNTLDEENQLGGTK